MPARLLKPGARTSKRLASCSDRAFRVFYQLIPLLDDFALYEADPDLLASECFPFGDSNGRRVAAEEMQRWLLELAAKDLLLLFEVDGRPYLWVRRWTERVRAKNPSRFPPPPGYHFQKTGENCQLCQQMPADASIPRQPLTNAALPSSYSNAYSSSTGREEWSVQQSRTQFAAIQSTIQRLQKIPEEERTSAQHAALELEQRRLKKLQKKQAAGDFTKVGAHE